MTTHEDIAASYGIVAAADAITTGQAAGLTREEIAADAHAAADEAYQLYLHLMQHAAGDEAQVEVGASRPMLPAASHHTQARHRPKKHARASVGKGGMPPLGHMPFSGGGGGHPHAAPHAPHAPHAHGGHGHHGHGHGGGGGGFMVDLEPEDFFVEEPCPPGSHLEELPDGTFVCVPDAALGGSILRGFDARHQIVGHGHGGGGHHGGHGHSNIFFGGGWDGYGYGYPYAPVVLACGPGQVLLADGTCVDLSQYGPAPAPVTVGGPVPESHDGWDSGAIVACHIEDDGSVTLPDGTSINAHDLDWSELAEVHDGASVGATAPPTTQTTTSLSTGAADVQQNARNLDNLWQQLNAGGAQAVADNKLTPTQWGQFQTDYGAWENWYNTAKSADQTSLFGGYGYNGLWYNSNIVNDYTTKASSWYNTLKQVDPTAWAANVQALPGPTVTPDAYTALIHTIEYCVIGVAIAVGVWLLWPIMTAGAAKGAAAIAGA